MLRDVVAVALGGALGASARFGVGLWLQPLMVRSGFPLATLLVNVVGCFALACLSYRSEGVARLHVLLLTSGFLGSFTTFSTFSLETMTLAESRGGLALLYALANLLLGFGAVLLAKRWLGS